MDDCCSLPLQKYQKILQQEVRALEVASERLLSLHQHMKKARLPLSLLEELQTAVELVNLRMEEQTKEGGASS